jgi:hypothetical protein
LALKFGALAITTNPNQTLVAATTEDILMQLACDCGGDASYHKQHSISFVVLYLL